MSKVYIFGHKKPDTDSVAASISLTYLKNKLGINAVARVLGDINNETKYMLKFFNLDEPPYLNDVKLQVKDVNFVNNYFMNSDESLFKGFNFMNEYNIGILPIIDENGTFEGLVSMKDIAKFQMSNDLNNLCTSYNNLLEVLNAESILKFDEKLDIKIIAASYRSTTFMETIDIKENTGLIVGDRHSIIEYAVNNKAKLIVLTGNSTIKEEHIKIAKENHVNIIRTDLDTFTTSRKIWLSNYMKTIKMNQEIVCFNLEDTIEEVMEKTAKLKFSNYPVVNKKNKCLGLLRISDISEATKKKVILVDHNEISQSVDGIEQAEIVEIIDHHKIGTIGTSMPINFRNMPVGSSNTIIYMLYKENRIEIPKNIAGAMLSGIISDTLLFKSPTTTEIDKMVVKELANIAEIDYEEYGMKMLKAGASLKGKTKEDVLFSDFKNFTIDGKKIGIGQITTFDIEEFEKDKQDYIDLINKTAEINEYYMVGLFVIDIIRNGSYIYYNDNVKEIFELSFDIDNIYQGYYIDGCISRKKQIIPCLMNILEKK